jgi:hypothetical protein
MEFVSKALTIFPETPTIAFVTTAIIIFSAILIISIIIRNRERLQEV